MRTRITGTKKLGEEYELDPGAYELRRSGRVLKLERIPMELLLLLVERRGSLVTRQEIIERIWGKDVYLGTDNSINAAIRKVRQVLRDDPEHPRFIQTVTGMGYRLIAPVGDLEAATVQPVDPAQTFPPENLIGRKISHYRVLQILGGGGMGVVYKAEDLKLGRSVAIKFLPAELASEPGAFERVEKEARAASSSDHPAICTIYELAEHEGRPFIVMQLLEGRTLREWIEKSEERENPGCMAEVARLGAQICSGLEAAHEKGIIHRDIKPSNIFVTARNEARILDFGVARLTEGAGPAAADNGPTSRARGASAGTPAYLSPEQIRGETLDARTDLFSFGVVLYEMASGRRAFPGETPAAIEDAIVRHTLTPLRGVDPKIPPALERIVARATEKDRERRYPSAREMGDDLKNLAASLTAGKAAPPPVSVAKSVRRPKRGIVIATLAVLVIGSVVAGLYYRGRLSRRLTEKDTVVIADFANSTGDAVFDDTLKQGLSNTLHQSPFLTILSDDKVAATLQRMTRPANAALTPEVAREVCRRAGSKVYIAGAIATLGAEYVLGLKAVNCQTGDTLAREQVTVESREKVIAALGEAARGLRGQLGESLATVQKYDVPLEEATTPSLDALKAFSLAYHQANSGAYQAAIPFYQRAIDLDPDFAVAHAHMGQAYANSQQNDLAVASIKKAFELRRRASELERFYIDTRYHELVTGDVDRRIEALELWEGMYPRDPIPHNDLGAEYSDMGRYEQARAEAEKTVELEPAGHTGYEVLGLAYIGLDRLAEARAVREKAVSLQLDNQWDHVDLYGIGFLQNDAALMRRETEWASGGKYEAYLLRAVAVFEASRGKLQKAKDTYQKAIDAAQREKLGNFAKNCALDLQMVNALLRPSPGPVVSTDGNESERMAYLYILSGKPARAEQIAAKMLRNEPTSAYVRNVFVPSIRAEIETAEGRPDKAVALLQASAPYELGWKAEYWPMFARGRARLRAGNGMDAAREFQKITDHPGVALAGHVAPVIYALSQLEEARALAMAGDRMAAQKAYRKFLDSWKDADADLPVLMQVKAELAKL